MTVDVAIAITTGAPDSCHGPVTPTTIAKSPEPDASKVMCRDTAELVDRVTGFGRDLDDPHDTILARWMSATACYATMF